MGVLQNFQNIRVRVKCCKISRSSGYCGKGVQGSQKFRAGTKGAVPVPRVLWHEVYRTRRSSGDRYESLTELPEVPGILARAYRTYRSPGYGYECPTEVTDVPGTGNTRVNAHHLGGEFDLKWRIKSDLHGTFSLDQCPRVKGIMKYRQNHHRERR